MPGLNPNVCTHKVSPVPLKLCPQVCCLTAVYR